MLVLLAHLVFGASVVLGYVAAFSCDVYPASIFLRGSVRARNMQSVGSRPQKLFRVSKWLAEGHARPRSLTDRSVVIGGFGYVDSF